MQQCRHKYVLAADFTNSRQVFHHFDRMVDVGRRVGVLASLLRMVFVRRIEPLEECGSWS